MKGGLYMLKKLKQVKWLNVLIFLVVMVGAIMLAQLYVLPDMVGWDMDRVKHYEAANEITLTYQYEYSEEIPYGDVITQRTCESEENCKLNLTISKGQDVSKLPKSEIQDYISMLITQDRILPAMVTYKDSEYSNEIAKDYAITYEPDPYLGEIEIGFSRGKQVIIETATMVGAGDVLLHDTVYQDFHSGGTEYDFTDLFKDVKEYISPADFAFVNQESNIGGAQLGVSSYPNFNSPYEIVDTLKATGFNMFARANNHTLDKGVSGVESASKHYDSLADIIHAGATDSQEKRDIIQVLDRNGIKVSLLSYTYGFNGHILPEDKPYLGNLFDEEQAEEDIKKAKEVSDVIVVSMHWGSEYMSTPSELQQEQAMWLADQGVHIIMGHHPHVLQPIEMIETEGGHETLVVYSLGNFVSGQQGIEKNVGGIVKFDITKTTVGNDEPFINISDVQFMPTYNYPADGYYRDYQLVPLSGSPRDDYFDTVKSIVTPNDSNDTQEVEVVEVITYN